MEASGLNKEAVDSYRLLTESAPQDARGWAHLAWSSANVGPFDTALIAADQLARVIPPTAAAISDYAWISIAPEQLDEREVLPRIEAFEQFIANQQDGSARALGKNCAAMARFKLALSRADLSGALAIAESQQQRGQNDIAGIMYLRLGDTRAEQAFNEAAPTARHRLWDWFYWTTMLTPELRRNSLLLEHEARMGVTDAWRHELCTRITNLPQVSGIDCDPYEHPMVET